MLIEPEISTVSIVLVGTLNPRIFNPDWFARHNLLTPQEAEKAEVQIIHAQISQFQSEWMTLQVESERLIATTAQAPLVRLRDFVTRTFREFLPHTPISKLGINRDVHYNVESFEVREQIGKRLAPPEAWGEWGQRIAAGEKDRHGGLISLVMQERDLKDRPKGYIQATVQPSVRIEPTTGIYVQVNDHYEVDAPDKVVGCEQIVDLLEQRFDESLKRSEWIIDQLMKQKG